MSAAVTKTRETIAKQQVTLEQIISYVQGIKKEPDLSERETALVSSVQTLAETLSEILERLSERIK